MVWKENLRAEAARVSRMQIIKLTPSSQENENEDHVLWGLWVLKEYAKSGTLYSAGNTWEVRSYKLDVAANYSGSKKYEDWKWRCWHVNMWTCGTWLSWLSWNRKYEDWKWRRQTCDQNVEEDQEPLDIWCPLITVIKCFKGHREIHLEWLELWSEKSPYHWIRMSWEELMMWRTRNYGGSQMGNIWKASKKQTKCVFGVLPLSKWRWV